MTGKSDRHAAAAYARWAALSPAERRAATEPGTAASATARRAKAERRAAREAERRAADDRTLIGAVQPYTLAEARRIVGPSATDRELAAQCLLVIKARHTASLADPTP